MALPQHNVVRQSNINQMSSDWQGGNLTDATRATIIRFQLQLCIQFIYISLRWLGGKIPHRMETFPSSAYFVLGCEDSCWVFLVINRTQDLWETELQRAGERVELQKYILKFVHFISFSVGTDDGEGHVGTVCEIGRCGSTHSPENTVVVNWDSGHRTNYRVGYQNQYDLIIVDNAQVGK